MSNLNEKIVAITELMQKGILTADELSSIIKVLNNNSTDENTTPQSPMVQKYESFMKSTVANAFKSPSTVKFPPLDASMIKEGKVTISEGIGSKTYNLRYIETYVDAQNSFGATVRSKIALVIDDNFNFTMVLQGLNNPWTGKFMQWMKIPGIDL